MATQLRKQLEYTPDPNKFDLRTHHWNAQGILTKKNLYTLYVIDGNKFFERPVNSGNLWYENNQPAGRVEYVDGKRIIAEGKAHIEYKAPLQGDEAIHYALEQEKARTAALEAELAAIKQDQTRRSMADMAKVEQPKKTAPALPSKG